MWKTASILAGQLPIGAGAAGLNATLAAQDKGLKFVLLEKGKIANTIEDFPEGKWIYAEPDNKPAKGKLWLDGVRCWREGHCGTVGQVVPYSE